MPEDERDSAGEDATQAMPLAGEELGLPSRSSDDATRRMDMPPAVEPGNEPGDGMASTRIISRSGGPSAPATERIAFAPVDSNIARWLIVLAIVIGLLVGGSVGFAGRKPVDSNVVARGLVSADGGVLTFDGTGKLTVPANALSTATSIKIRRENVNRRVRLGQVGDPRSVLYEPGELVVYVFEPPNLRFQQPVTIELPRDGNGTAVFIDDADSSPRIISGRAGNSTVTIETTSFSFDSP